MHFVVIFGPPAVGKMTVGHELAQRTGFKLFHNHMTIELVLNFFPYGHPQFRTLVNEFRRRIFEEVAASSLPGLIFTYMWTLDDPQEKRFLDESCAIFRRHGGTAYFVELEADQAERLRRNMTAFRLAQKPSKRDVVQSQHRLLEADRHYKLNSMHDFDYSENYVKINNTTTPARAVAQHIIDHFVFPTVDSA